MTWLQLAFIASLTPFINAEPDIVAIARHKRLNSTKRFRPALCSEASVNALRTIEDCLGVLMCMCYNSTHNTCWNASQMLSLFKGTSYLHKSMQRVWNTSLWDALKMQERYYFSYFWNCCGSKETMENYFCHSILGFVSEITHNLSREWSKHESTRYRHYAFIPAHSSKQKELLPVGDNCLYGDIV